jgi:hypothetical protein
MGELLLIEALPDLWRGFRHLQKNGLVREIGLGDNNVVGEHWGIQQRVQVHHHIAWVRGYAGIRR